MKNGFKKAPREGEKFLNLDKSGGEKRPFDILKWKLKSDPFKKRDKKSNLKVIKSAHPAKTKEDYICWLGHSSFLIQIEKTTILTDPIFGAPLFFKRYTDLPFPKESLKADFILISHGHYDHLDSKTLKHFKDSTALVPLKMKPLVQKINRSLKVLECDWYEKYRIDEPFCITFLPARHWHKRTPNDTNKILWGSFLIQSQKQTIYFAGDTAYGEHFKEIAKIADIDYALLPIGAYEPRWFMKNNHLNPKEALQAFKDLKAKTLIPMHYGTFSLSDEPLNEPPRKLKEFIKDEKVMFLDIGEFLRI